MTTEQLQRLKLAFVIDHVQRIIAADGGRSYQEYQLVGQIFPRALLDDAGFLDDGELNARWRDHRDMAAQILPGLPADQRQDVLRLLHGASAIDEVDARELRALTEAGQALGFSPDQITGLLVEFELDAP